MLKEKLKLFKTLMIVIPLTIFVNFSNIYATEPEIDREKVILIHGFGRSKVAMWQLYLELHIAGYDVKNIGYSSFNKTIEEIKTTVFNQINTVSFKKYKQIHFVGHSLGGLLCRAYLDEHRIKNLGNVVLIGSPNGGTELVDTYKQEWWFEYAGPTAKMLGTDKKSFPNSLKEPYYTLGVIAGSASVDIDMIKNAFEGEHDGMVSVESTKVKGMKDFIKIETSHSMMRYNDDVAYQTIHFLRYKNFMHKN